MNPSPGWRYVLCALVSLLLSQSLRLHAQALPTLSVSDASVVEGHAGSVDALFHVTLSHPSTQTVTVVFATANGSASAAFDFSHTECLLSFPAGITNLSTMVEVFGDLVSESNEMFFVSLSRPSGATMADALGSGTILDDELAADVYGVIGESCSPANGAVDPGETVTLELFIRNPGLSTTTNLVATLLPMGGVTGPSDPQNYDLLDPGVIAVGRQFTFAADGPCGAPLTPTLQLQDGTNNLGQIRFNLIFGATGMIPFGAQCCVSPATVDLTAVMVDSPDPVAIFNVVTYTITVTNRGPATATLVTVTNRITPGLIFDSASAPQGCTIVGTNVICSLGTLASNASAQAVIVFFVPFNGVFSSSATVGAAELDRNSNNNRVEAYTLVALPALLVTPASRMEGNAGTTNIDFKIRLSGSNTVPVSVSFATLDGSAVAGSDFVATNGIVVFSPGQTTSTVSIVILSDMVNELDESFSFTLSSPSNAQIGTGSALGTILNDDPLPTLSVNDVSVLEGNTGSTSAIFSISLSFPGSRPVTVNYALGNGTATAPSDFALTRGRLSFNVGETIKTITNVVLGDVSVESNEFFLVRLTNPVEAILAKDHGAGTIINDDGFPGQNDHFTWSAIASPRHVDQGSTVSISALDAFGIIVSNFSGTASLMAVPPIDGARQDDFNGANGLPLGPAWTAVAGLWRIESGRARNSAPLGSEVVHSDVAVFVTTNQANGASVDVFYLGAPRLTYAAILLGFADLTNSVFVKVQDNSASGSFNTAHFYYGNNRSVIWNGELSALSPFTQARMTVRFSGNNVALEIDRNFDSVPEDVLTRSGFPVAKLGTGIALGGYNDAAFDNFLIGTNRIVRGVLMTPSETGPFTNGIWSGALSVLTAATNIVLRATDGDGHFGQTLPFDVVAPVLSVGRLGASTPGIVELQLSGMRNETYVIQASTDLTFWMPIYSTNLVTNSAVILDPDTTSFTLRFYRALWER